MIEPLVPELVRARMRCTAKVRVLFADTDQMGVVYHASYLRYLELARVELCRRAGLSIPTFEPRGLGLPLIELAVRYRAPARYDDVMSIHVAISLLTAMRLHFDYLVTVEPGDGAITRSEDRRSAASGPASSRQTARPELIPTQRLELLGAQTRHACIRLSDGRPTRLPSDVVATLESCYAPR
jgi:acyl-CoA thioester hydrolase